MDGSRFDALARVLGGGGPRRPLLGAGLATLVAAGLSVSEPLDSEGRGKGKGKGKGNKKKCKGKTKKCGKKCIPADQCCSSADCGNGGQCSGGVCSCPANQKSCNGQCIPQSACCTASDCGSAQTCRNGVCTCEPDTKACGLECLPPTVCCSRACPGEQTCDNGECLCANPSQNPCADGSCVSGFECCVDSQCPDGQQCVDGTCWCDGDGIYCNGACCDAGDTDEICVRVSTSYTCESGGCGTANWCEDPGEDYCSYDQDGVCVCQMTREGASSCLDRPFLQSPTQCTTCDTDSDCDTGYVCINDGQYCTECPGSFCALTCEAAATQRTPHRTRASAARSIVPGKKGN